MSFELDLSEFTPQMEMYVELSKLSSAQALNKKAIDVAKTAAGNTPFASKGSIDASLHGDPHLLAALTSIHLRKTEAGILKTPLFKRAMENLQKAREQGIKYLRSGWAPCIEQLGSAFRGGRYARARGKAFTASARSSALYAAKTGIHSYANPATPVQLEAVIVWVTDQPNARKQEGAEAIANKALQDAVDYQAADMAVYVEERLAKVLA